MYSIKWCVKRRYANYELYMGIEGENCIWELRGRIERKKEAGLEEFKGKE